MLHFVKNGQPNRISYDAAANSYSYMQKRGIVLHKWKELQDHAMFRMSAPVSVEAKYLSLVAHWTQSGPMFIMTRRWWAFTE